MIIDKNGKLFGKVNLIDILIIVALVAAAVGIGGRFFSSASKNVTDKVQLRYVVEIENVRIYTVNALENKGIVTDNKTGNIIGEIEDVEYSAMKTESTKANGRIVSAEVPDRYKVLVTVLSEGNETDGGYYIGENIVLCVGSNVSMATKYVNSSGMVKSIEKVN